MPSPENGTSIQRLIGAVRSLLIAIAAFVALSTTAEAQATRSTAYPGGVWEPGPARFGAVVVDDVPVTMDDGVVLRASVAYPTDPATGKRASGTFPVVVEHTPYIRLQGPIVPNTYLTGHGYIYAVVRARGTGTSGGELQYFTPRDSLDGKAIVDWAANHIEGADGRVALLGCSWAGGLALSDAAYVGPNSPVKAVVAACMGLSGLQRQSMLVSGLQTTRMATLSTGLLPLVGNTPSAAKVMSAMADDIASGGAAAYDGAFWRDRRAPWMAQKLVDNGIPVLLWSGWQDFVDIGAIRTYGALQNAAAGRSVDLPMSPDIAPTPRYQIVAGDWGHTGGLDAGIYLQWLETWVKGVDTGMQDTTGPMHLFETGSKRWVNLRGFPAVATSTSWHLGADGALGESVPASGDDTLVWAYPSEPNAKIGFMTLPIAEGATLAGPISATIYAKSSNTNLVMIAKLFDVAPDGSESEISRGAILGSQRELDDAKSWKDTNGTITWPWPTLQRDSYLTPGEVYRFDIALAPRLAGIAPGHRIRLDLSTRSPVEICPPDALPPRAGSDICALTAPQQKTVPGGTYTLMFGPDHPSALNLPQLSWQALPGVGTTFPPTAWNESQHQIDGKSLGLPLEW